MLILSNFYSKLMRSLGNHCHYCRNTNRCLVIALIWSKPLSGYTLIFSSFISMQYDSSKGVVSFLWSKSIPHAQKSLEWKRIFHSIWKNFDTEFTGILNSLRRHKDLVERRASLSQFHRYQIDMLEIKTKLDEVLTAERKKKLLSVKEWLAVSSQTETDQVRFNGIRREYSTTSKWILDREHVKHWIEADVPTTPCELWPTY